MLKTQRRVFCIRGDRSGPNTIDLRGWPLKNITRFRVSKAVLPPVDDDTYPELDLALISFSGASGRGVLAPHVLRDGGINDWSRYYTMALPIVKGSPTSYTTSDYNWDVVEREPFSIESLTMSICLANGSEINFNNADRWVILEIETD